MAPSGCSGMWLRSIKEIPDTVGVSDAKLSTVNDMLQCNVAFIAPERMPYVGYNKWLTKIIYASKSADGHLYLKGNNPQFMYLSRVKMSAVFSDPQKAAEMSCDGDGNPNACNILEADFPLEDALIPSCIEMVVQELVGSRYAPEDKNNNAKDDLGQASVTPVRQRRPAQAEQRSQEEEAE